MRNVKVSIIIPVYNTAHFLQRCLDSIFVQTLKDIEVIIVNDGSTDRSEEIINRYVCKYDNIIFINQENSGQGGARNKALEVCKGEYVGFVDSDDFVDEDMFNIMYSKAKVDNLDIVLCKFIICDSKGKSLNVYDVEYDESLIIDKEIAVKHFLASNDIEGFSCNKLFKRELFNKNIIKYPLNMKYEDIPTILNTLLFSNRIGFINKSLYYYIQHSGSTTNTKNYRNILDYFKAIELIRTLLINRGYYKEMKDEYYYYYVRKRVSCYVDLIKSFSKIKMMELEKVFSVERKNIKIGDILLNKYFLKDYKCSIKAICWKLSILDKIIRIKKRIKEQ